MELSRVLILTIGLVLTFARPVCAETVTLVCPQCGDCNGDSFTIDVDLNNRTVRDLTGYQRTYPAEISERFVVWRGYGWGGRIDRRTMQYFSWDSSRSQWADMKSVCRKSDAGF